MSPNCVAYLQPIPNIQVILKERQLQARTSCPDCQASRCPTNELASSLCKGPLTLCKAALRLAPFVAGCGGLWITGLEN